MSTVARHHQVANLALSTYLFFSLPPLADLQTIVYWNHTCLRLSELLEFYVWGSCEISAKSFTIHFYFLTKVVVSTSQLLTRRLEQETVDSEQQEMQMTVVNSQRQIKFADKLIVPYCTIRDQGKNFTTAKALMLVNSINTAPI